MPLSSPQVLLDCKLGDPARRRFKIGEQPAGARDTNVVVDHVRWPGVQSIHIEDRPRRGGERLRILTVMVRRRGDETEWPLIPVHPFDVRVTVAHPDTGAEFAAWDLPAAVVARVQDETPPGGKQEATIRFEAVVVEDRPDVAVSLVPIRVDLDDSGGPEDFGGSPVSWVVQTSERIAAALAVCDSLEDHDPPQAHDLASRVKAALTGIERDPEHKAGVYGQHPDPAGRPCTVLKGATCFNPACVDERTDRGGKTECHAFEPGGNLLVSIPFDEPAEATELDGVVTDRPELGFDEARALGVIVELNRRVLHPVGLAIGMADDDALTEAHLARIEAQNPGIDIDQVRASQSVRRRLVIWDGRDDPDGVVFGDWSEERVAKASAFMALEKERYPDRQAKLGFIWESPKCPKCGWALVPKPDGVSFGCVRRECLMGTSG